MGEIDILNQLLSSNPNHPAVNGVVILLRAEMRSEFETTRGGIGRLDARMDRLETRMDGLESRMDRLETRMDGLESRMDRLETRMDGLESKMVSLETRMDGLESKMVSLEVTVAQLVRSVELVAQNVLVLVARKPSESH